jgi:tetratricopeptide (TPR) repeat protein
MMLNRRYGHAGLVVMALAVASCQRPSATQDVVRQTCLADPRGTSPLDDAIRSSQNEARRLSANADLWTVAGQGWVRKARITADPGFYVNVQACADTALRISRDHKIGLQLSSLALMNAHRFAEAKNVANDVVTREPSDAFSHGILSDALLELGDFDASAAAAQRMVDLRPDMSSYSRAAYLRWLQGDTASAKLFMRYALDGRDSKDREPTAWAFTQAATLYWQEGDYAGADAVLVEALKWVPDYAPALTARARVAIGVGDAARAIAYLEKAYAISPLAETAWLLGDAREMLGDADGARREFERTVAAGRASDRLTLALFYATKNRDVAEALRAVEAERATRGGVYVDDVYAWTLFRAGRLDEARRASDAALRLGTKDARLLYHAGAIRLAQGDRAGGDLIRQALHLNPAFDMTGAAEAGKMVSDARRWQTH